MESRPVPKRRRIVNKDLLSKAAKMRCTVFGCAGKSVPAHIKSRGAGGDDSPENIMIICQGHHIEQHTIGLKRFRAKYPEVKTYAQINGVSNG